MTKVLDGRAVAKKLNKETQEGVARLQENGVQPKIAIMRADQNPASIQYGKTAGRFMEKLGIETEFITFPEGVSETEFLEELRCLNQNPAIHGILVMQPLPANISRVVVAKTIDPLKDIDGMHALNLGKIMEEDQKALLPSTVKAVMEIIKYYNFDVKGQNICVVGKSNTVGKPLSVLLMNLCATVTNCHLSTKDLKHFTSQADILISATGSIHLITEEHVKKDAIVIDVGFNFEGNKILGDVDYEEVFDKVRAITPVPGGVGSVTTASLANQLVLTAEYSKK